MLHVDVDELRQVVRQGNAKLTSELHEPSHLTLLTLGNVEGVSKSVDTYINGHCLAELLSRQE